ncbi:MAG: peptidoglycan-binding domain-containing protein [Sulfitobacter sp.]|uniref:peptidoglycan-binding domain-containing protein n=1 Tax=Sulfitobacter sp. TaxID=1903071 RepID=UPI00405A39CC
MQFLSNARLITAPALIISMVALSSCGQPQEPVQADEPGVREATSQGPAGAPPGTCWGRTISPAVIETVTKQRQVKPAQISATGEIQTLPVYKTETLQEIVRPRQDNWFETPCPNQWTPDFISTLQRALEAREAYDGDITGALDDPTRQAMRRYQIGLGGPDSPVLALDTARALGLIAVERTP